MVKGCVSVVLIHATFDHVYLDSTVHSSKEYSLSGSNGGLHSGEVQIVVRVFGGGHLEGEGDPADERGWPGT